MKSNNGKKLERLKGEVFVSVEGFPHYEVSNMGRVISTAWGYEKLLKPALDAVGYNHYRLFNKGSKTKLFKAHRLVGQYFVPNEDPEVNIEINHIDGNKNNNVASNLQWVTRKYNIHHSHQTGLFSLEAKRKGGIKRRKLVKVTYADGTSKYCSGLIYAAFDLGVAPATIKKYIKEQKTHTEGWRVEQVEEMPVGEVYERLERVEKLIREFNDKYYGHLRKVNMDGQ